MLAKHTNTLPSVQFCCPLCTLDYNTQLRQPMILCLLQHTCCLSCLHHIFKGNSYDEEAECPFCYSKIRRDDVRSFELVDELMHTAESISIKAKEKTKRIAKRKGKDRNEEEKGEGKDEKDERPNFAELYQKQQQKTEWLLQQFQQQLIMQERQLPHFELTRAQVQKKELKLLQQPQVILANDHVSCSASNFFAFQLQPYLINLNQVTKITVKNYCTDEKFWTVFTEIKEQTLKFDSLSFENCILDSLHHLRFLIISKIAIINSNFRDEDLSKFFSCLNPYQINQIDLSFNNIGKNSEQVFDIFCKWLIRVFGISRLDLTGNPLGNKVIEQLRECLKWINIVI